MNILKDITIHGQRLILGDCLKVMPDLGPVDHIVSDPPYEKFMHAKKAAASRRLRTDRRREIQPLDFSAIDDIREEYVAAAERLCGGWFVNFCTPEGVRAWADVINKSKIKYKRACVWVKPDSTPQLNGQGPAMGAEMFVCAWAGTGFAKWNAGGKRGVYTHNTNPRDRHGAHPTEKPWRLFVEILQDFTTPSDVVLDPFMGSGTTLIACMKTGRRGVGIEQNSEYFDVAVERVRQAGQQGDMFLDVPKSDGRSQAVLL